MKLWDNISHPRPFSAHSSEPAPEASREPQVHRNHPAAEQFPSTERKPRSPFEILATADTAVTIIKDTPWDGPAWMVEKSNTVSAPALPKQKKNFHPENSTKFQTVGVQRSTPSERLLSSVGGISSVDAFASAGQSQVHTKIENIAAAASSRQEGSVAGCAEGQTTPMALPATVPSFGQTLLTVLDSAALLGVSQKLGSPPRSGTAHR
jgi:hypothetical protein